MSISEALPFFTKTIIPEHAWEKVFFENAERIYRL